MSSWQTSLRCILIPLSMLMVSACAWGQRRNVAAEPQERPVLRLRQEDGPRQQPLGEITAGEPAPLLPKDAQDLVRAAETEQLAAQREMEARVAKSRQDLLRSLQALAEAYTKGGHEQEASAINSRIAQMRAVMEPPPNLTAYRDHVGETYVFNVTGQANGALWGSNPYTDDSALGAAAVHAGVLREGEWGGVHVKIVPGQASYEGSTRNGVTSRPYGAWQGSYQVLGPKVEPIAPAAQIRLNHAKDRIVNPNALQELRDCVGDSFDIELVGTTQGSVWGNLVYTDDSSIAAAAVHAGVLREGEKGTVRVTILPGQDSYDASSAHGVRTGTWRAFGGSFTVDRVEKEQP